MNNNKNLSIDAKEFIPSGIVISIKPKKTKDQRACPRKRRKPKNKQINILNQLISYNNDNISDDMSDEWSLWLDQLSLTKSENRYSPIVEEKDIYINNHSLTNSPIDSFIYMNNYNVDNEIQNELIERKKWSAWAIKTAEIERQRRIDILKAFEIEEENERMKRCQWAINAIETERNDRISNQFLLSLTSTNWFNEAISAYNDDYELVCPYYKLGCQITCYRSNIAKHLLECPFAIEQNCNYNIDTSDDDYEVVCPNAVIGCSFIGRKGTINHHLTHECLFNGIISKEKEQQERLKTKESVINDCEVERIRRLDSNTDRNSFKSINQSDSKSDNQEDNNISLVHQLLMLQRINVLQLLHQQIISYYSLIQLKQLNKQNHYNCVINYLTKCITNLWCYACVQVYGSFATQLYTTHSDLDIVICFCDEYQSLTKISGTFPLLHILSYYITNNPLNDNDMDISITISNILLTAKIPVIKAVAIVNNISIPIDISIDSPTHTGLATTAMIQTISEAIPTLLPIVLIIKEYLYKNGLYESHSGGLSSYGIILLSLLPMLKRISTNRSLTNYLAKSVDNQTNKSNSKCNSPSIDKQINKRIHIDSYNNKYSWNNIQIQKNYGRLVGLKLCHLLSDNLSENIIDITIPNLLSINQSDMILGELLEDLLIEYGEKMICGLHGYSVRDFGFRFNVTSNDLSNDLTNQSTNQLANYPSNYPTHPQANDPIIIEDPVNVINNVGSNCYKALAIQRLLLDAKDKLTNIFIRYNSNSNSNQTSPRTSFRLSNSSNNTTISDITNNPCYLLYEIFNISLDS